jgi:hypothetical protein
VKDALFNWAKLILENWKTITAILGLFVSLGGVNIFQYFQVEAKEQQIKVTQQQVAQVAEAYRPYIVQIEKPAERPTKSQVVIKEKCNCDISGLTKRIEKLERWH